MDRVRLRALDSLEPGLRRFRGDDRLSSRLPTIEGHVRRLPRIVLGHSIRGRVGRYFFLAGLMPFVALSLMVVASGRADFRAAAEANLSGQAEIQAAAVAGVIEQAREAVTVLANNPAIRDASHSPWEIRDQLEAFSLLEEVTLLNPDGTIIHATSYGYAGRWDANAAFNGALEGRDVMTPPLFYPDPQRLVIEFGVPHPRRRRHDRRDRGQHEHGSRLACP